MFGGYWTFFFITASFGHLKKIGIKELLGSDIWGGGKKNQRPTGSGYLWANQCQRTSGSVISKKEWQRIGSFGW